LLLSQSLSDSCRALNINFCHDLSQTEYGNSEKIIKREEADSERGKVEMRTEYSGENHRNLPTSFKIILERDNCGVKKDLPT
jgi:hypothetical protein